MRKRPAVFLDRDGTIVEHHNVLTKDKIRLLPTVAAAIKRFHRAGFLVVMVTNQPPIARGQMTEGEVHAVNTHIRTRVALGGGDIDAFYVCPHHPEGTLVQYRKKCSCRKPRAGLLRRAARDWNIDLRKSVMIGDVKIDVVAGKRAGTKTILVTTGPGHRLDEKYKGTHPDATVSNLTAAADFTLKKFFKRK